MAGNEPHLFVQSPVWRDWTQDGRRQSQNCQSAAASLEGVSGGRQEILRSLPHLPRAGRATSNGKQADVIRIGR
jgi:hypothetical protein